MFVESVESLVLQQFVEITVPAFRCQIDRYLLSIYNTLVTIFVIFVVCINFLSSMFFFLTHSPLGFL